MFMTFSEMMSAVMTKYSAQFEAFSSWLYTVDIFFFVGVLDVTERYLFYRPHKTNYI